MKPWPRTRKCVKWGGAVVTVLLVAAWVGSLWWRVAYLDDSCGRAIVARQGCLQVCWQSSSQYELGGTFAFNCWSLERDAPWWKDSQDDTQVPSWPAIEELNASTVWAFWELSLPFWSLVAPTLAATLWAWRLDHLAYKRSRTDLCPACGYSRTGLNPGSPCPECGKPEPARA